MGLRPSLPTVLMCGWLALEVVLLALCREANDSLCQWLAVALHAQLVVTSGWTVLGNRGIAATAVVLIAALLIGAGLTSENLHGRVAGFLWWSGYLILINLPLIGVRLCGGRFHFHEHVSHDTEKPRGLIRFWQFSLRDLLSLMVVGMLLAAAWRHLAMAPLSHEMFAAFDRLNEAIFKCLFVLPWSIWAAVIAFRARHTWLVVLSSHSLLGIMIARYIGDPSGDLYIIGALLFWSGIVLTQLLVLHWAGYHWHWQRP